VVAAPRGTHSSLSPHHTHDMGRKAAAAKRRKQATRKQRLLAPFAGRSGVCEFCGAALLSTTVDEETTGTAAGGEEDVGTNAGAECSTQRCPCPASTLAALPADMRRLVRHTAIGGAAGASSCCSSGGGGDGWATTTTAVTTVEEQKTVVGLGLVAAVSCLPVLPPSPLNAAEFARYGGPQERPSLTIAPMMAWTDHHFRQLVRLIERQWRLDNEDKCCISSGTTVTNTTDSTIATGAADATTTTTSASTSSHPTSPSNRNGTSSATPHGCSNIGGVLLVTEMLEAERMARMAVDDPPSLCAMVRFSPAQQPIAAQIGGCDADSLAAAARTCAAAGYSEVNLNVGCPSNPVCGRGFGVALMKEPATVAGIVAQVRAAVPPGCVGDTD
jgi:hypothetical protein